jgi:hypothetical protein
VIIPCRASPGMCRGLGDWFSNPPDTQTHKTNVPSRKRRGVCTEPTRGLPQARTPHCIPDTARPDSCYTRVARRKTSAIFSSDIFGSRADCTTKGQTHPHSSAGSQWQPLLVAHACNPSYSGGREQKDGGLKPAQEKFVRPYLKKT